MRVLFFIVLVLVVIVTYVASDAADQASRLGPEERRTLLDDDIFMEDSKSRNGVNSRKRDCARDFEDCRHKNCCNQCTRCACKRGGRDCRCNERNELALFLGLCRK